MFDAWLWARDPDTFGRGDTEALPIEDKESVRWLEGYQRLVELAPELPDSELVYVADREADIYELFVAARDAPVQVLVRACYDRALLDGAKLRATLEQAPALGTVTFELPKTTARARRTVTQSLHAKRVSIRAPRGKRRLAPGVELTAVLAHEVDPSEGSPPVQWLLLTTLPVETSEQATRMLQWYLCRWEIELLFKVLKSGCEVEELQLQSTERLEPAIAMYLIIAWRVMLLTMTGRTCPDLPCDVVLETEEWHAIYMVSERAPPPPEPPPLDTFVRMLAGLGGFLNRKHDGPPGNKCVWIGLQRTRDFVLALRAYQAAGP